MRFKQWLPARARHASTEDVTRHSKGHLKGEAKKVLKSLYSNNYCYLVGGKKNKRYKLTRDGLNLALDILNPSD